MLFSEQLSICVCRKVNEMGTVIEHKLEKEEWTSSIHMNVHNIICLDYQKLSVSRYNKFLNHTILWKVTIKLINVM